MGFICGRRAVSGDRGRRGGKTGQLDNLNSITGTGPNREEAEGRNSGENEDRSFGRSKIRSGLFPISVGVSAKNPTPEHCVFFPTPCLFVAFKFHASRDKQEKKALPAPQTFLLL